MIGGGNSGVKESLFLSNIVHSLTILTDFEMTADEVSLRQLYKKTNVKILTHQQICGFEGTQRSAACLHWIKNQKKTGHSRVPVYLSTLA